MSGYENALAPSTVFADSPAITASQVSARVNKSRMPATASHSSALAPERNPKMNATPHDERERDGVGHEGGQYVTPLSGRAGDRHGLESLEDPALQVHEEPVRGVGDAGRNRDEQDAGEHVVDVRVRTGVDGSAEDEHEQRHDRHGGDGGGDDRVGTAQDVAERPPGENRGVAEGWRGHNPTSLVRARKTSSRFGCFSTYSTFAGGSSCLSSARVPSTMMRPS